jgi:outer membrane protein assembly factor BamD (BamD/ComL family)
MKPEKYFFGALLILALMSSGCAGRMPGFLVFSEPERTLNEARDQLRAGNEQQARDQLEKVIKGPPTVGVTDEAIFRLALLSLKEDGGNGIQRAQSLLERLAEKYPDSIWTRQSAPLRSHLADIRVLRNRQRELKTLRDDNKELRQSLERLKQLDLELEQKIKR